MRRVIRALLFCFLVFFALEVGLRFFGYGQYVIYQPDASLLWVPRPSQKKLTVAGHQRITINSDGLRYEEDFSRRDPREIRVYTFGDSVTMGWGVDDRSHYSAVLERLLREKYPEAGFRVVSAGVNAYPIALCVRRFEQLLDNGHQIDVAILAYSFNSGIENFARLEGEDKDKLLRKVALKSILRRSAVYNFLIEDLLRAAVYYRLRDRLIVGTWDVDTEKGIDKLAHYDKSLEEMKERAEHEGVKLGLLLVGSRDQDELNDHQRAFLDFASSTGLPVVNMVDLLRGTPQKDLFMSADVNHPNATGHELIARSLLPMAEQLSRIQDPVSGNARR